MAFPTTGILDSFNRADENPLVTASNGDSWQSLPGAGGLGVTALAVVSNICVGNGGVGSNMYLDHVFNADCEAYVTITGLGSTNNVVELFFRLVDIGTVTAVDGYILRWTNVSGTDTIRLNRLDNLGETTLATFNQEVTAGDSIGARIIGTGLEAFYKPSAGAWTSLGTASDATYASGGRIAVTLIGTPTVDSFGGGSYVPPSVIPRVIWHLRQQGN